METIYLAGGCFWGTQRYFDQFEGVLKTEVGYANGTTENPSYEEVKKGAGHAETVKIDFDEKILPLSRLLDYYFDVIDPFAVNRQGPDIGVQYRTGIYYTNDEQQSCIDLKMQKFESGIGRKSAVEVKRLVHFFSAEEYHQKYLEKNPGGYCHIPEEKFYLNEG